MATDLERLLDLQNKDLALLEVDLRLRGLLEKVDSLDAEVASARLALEESRKAHAAGTRRREEVEAKVDGLRVLQDRRRQRLDLVKTPRELQALTSELELSRSVLAKEEAEWFRVSEAVNALEQQVREAERRVEELGSGQAGAREDLAAQIAVVEAERAAAQAERRASAEEITRPLLLRYDRLRGARQTRVVVALRGDACGACHTAVPMSRRSHIRAGMLDGCEACGVILYAADNEEE